METIGKSEAWGYFEDQQPNAVKAKNSAIRHGAGHRVTSYLDLAKKVAELQFRNPEHILLFRGQDKDYKNDKGNTTLKPSLLRHQAEDRFRPPASDVLERRFGILKEAERRLVSEFNIQKLDGRHELARYRILRWSILQHYEVCSTPLLDVSQSIRIAASFASQTTGQEAFLYVLAVPNISGVITASAEAGLQIVRLSGICPPTAVRPHIQEGYLLGEYPDMPDFEQKQHYAPYEIDFGRRLIAKFRLDLDHFWGDANFQRIGREALYPNDHDDLFQTLYQLKQQAAN